MGAVPIITTLLLLNGRCPYYYYKLVEWCAMPIYTSYQN